jgi:protein-S-isoprenylcysteine O-methyltransferase Ste14
MILLADVTITVSLTSFFCIVHSILASNKVKKAFQNNFGNLIAYYRIGYNIISVILLITIYPYFPQINITLYDLPNPYDLIILFMQLLSLMGFVWSAGYFSSGEFIGLNQIKRLRNGNYNPADIDEYSTFRVEGPYKYSRHPVYFFSILFLIMRPVMSLTYFIIVVIFVVYFYIGSLFEEKRLVEKFGVAYIDYQKTVPRIIPVKVFRV